MKTDKEKPFKILLSREQQLFLKELKKLLKEFLENVKAEEEVEDDTLKTYYITKAIFNLPAAEQNLFLIKTFGEYDKVTQLANELNITKLTICSHIRKTKIYIKNYVDKHI